VTKATLNAAVVEAILFAAPEPVRPHDVASAFGSTVDEVVAFVEQLRSSYAERDAGIEVRRIGDAYRIYTRSEYAEAVGHYANRSRVGRLSRPALETLAIVAYKQPVTRAEISRVRGVNVDSVLATLQERGLVAEVGRESGPGRAPAYGTTPLFLEKIGLGSVADLPPLASFAPSPEVAAEIEQALAARGVEAEEEEEPAEVEEH
jgi:segregation and condensation protein B